jgi:hypothetical protein
VLIVTPLWNPIVSVVDRGEHPARASAVDRDHHLAEAKVISRLRRTSAFRLSVA